MGWETSGFQEGVCVCTVHNGVRRLSSKVVDADEETEGEGGGIIYYYLFTCR